MPIRFTCPHCGAETDVAERYAGQTGPCARCGKEITVPPLVGRPERAGGSGGALAACAVVAVVVLGILGLLSCAGIVFLFGFRASAPPPTLMPTPVAAAPGQACSSKLQQIGFAMITYQQQHGSFPPAYETDADGKPLRSWRVLLLPCLGEPNLYNLYRLDEPWDSPNNAVLAPAIADVYRCPDDYSAAPGDTSYVMIVGEGMVSDGPGSTKLREIADGPGNTILVVETTASGIGAAEPRDLDADSITFGINDGSAKGIRSNHGDGTACVLMADGTVRNLSRSTSPATVRALATIAGGEGAAAPEPEASP